MQMNDLTLI